MAPKKAAPRPPQPSDPSSPPSPGRFHKIREVEVTGGFLEGFKAELDEHLNCVIGGRGTGKTTVLELLRFAFRGRPDENTPFDKLIQKNLSTGELRVVVETKDGRRYTVQRTASGQPEITDAAGITTPHDLGAGNLFAIDVYSQSEIESIAVKPESQLALIDHFAAARIEAVNEQIAELLRALRANARALLDHEQGAEDSERGQGDLPGLEARLQSLPPVSGAQAALIEDELRKKTQRGDEERAIKGIEPVLEEERGLLTKASATLDQLDGLLPESLLKGPNAPPLDALRAGLRAGRARIEAALQEARAGVDALGRALEKASTDLRRRHEDQDSAYRGLLTTHEKEKGLADERVSLQQRINELRERKRAVTAHEQEIHRLQELRRGLLRRLSELRDQRADVRRDVARELSESLAPDIRVRIQQGKDGSQFMGLVNQALKGSGRPYTDLTKTVAARYTPSDFVRLVQAGKIDELATTLGHSPKRVDVFLALKGTEAIYEIEVADLGDEPAIELWDGEEWKGAEQLSTGQKCTTVLPILLLDSERPLIVDQPEDNLDNAYIYNTVVKRLREMQGRRQFLFATHNPNIPVLGSAGQVLVLEATGKRSRVVARGDVDQREVREHVEKILEGGAEAFKARKERYGY